MIGRRLGVARAAIRAAGCEVGRISRIRSRRRTGIVLAQSPKAARQVAHATRVDLVVSRGRKHR